jgi:dienelactone hydrolase
VRAADLHGVLRNLAEFDAVSVSERDVEVPLATGTMRARVYEPAGRARQTTLLVSGLHPSGIEEPRLTGLARQLAASGVIVVTPDIPDLRQFVIGPSLTDAIERAASWLAAERTLAPEGRIGLMGISFSGGLSIVAAGRPGLRDRIAYVFSFGGHGDLPRVLRYLCTGLEVPPPGSDSPLAGLMQKPGEARTAATAGAIASGWVPPPHDYGVAVILLGVAERVVPATQVAPLRTAVRRFLQASAWDRDDKPRAAKEFAALRALAQTMPEPSATLLRYVNDRDVVHLGARLVTHVGPYGDPPALSAERSPAPSAPVFLLHGIDDNVIPAVESVHLAAALRGTTPVRVLLSGLISHAEADRPPRVADVMALASFWGDLLQR